LRAKDVLLEALRAFKGTVVFVSHDRYFIDNLATRIFEIENGGLREYAGNYEDYLWQKQRQTVADAAAQASRPAAEQADGKQAPRTTKKQNPHRVRKMQERRQELEKEISRCESEITTSELGLANFQSAEESIRLAKLIPELRAHLQEMMQEWEQVSGMLEREDS
jgi:ATP-binding cassette subfamily F protein 3